MLRKELEQYPVVDVGTDWYRVLELPHRIYAISEPYHFQEVISFLILGETSAILLDTGMGLEPIRSVVSKLTDLPVIPIMSHGHFDHIGGNYEFDSVWGWPAEATVKASQQDEIFAEDDPNIQPDAFERPVEIENYCRRAYKLNPLTEGQEFDLGGRLWKVKFIGGHSDDSVVLYNEKEKLLCTGDLIYPGPLYVKTGLKEYMDSCEKLAEKFADYTLICSHNIPLADGTLLSRVATTFGELRRGTLEGEADCRGRMYYRNEDVELLIWPGIRD